MEARYNIKRFTSPCTPSEPNTTKSSTQLVSRSYKKATSGLILLTWPSLHIRYSTTIVEGI